MPERRKRDKLLIAAAACGVVSLLISVPVSVGVLRNQDRIEGNQDHIEVTEQQDRDRLREAAFRLCARDMQNRADLHASAQQRGEVRLRRERERRLPIVDCSPNLDGGTAQVVPVHVQRRYVRLFAQGRQPVICDGRVLSIPAPSLDAMAPACRGVRLVH